MQDKPAKQAEEVAQRYKIGDLIQNRYEVYDVLTGGFGVVYICYDDHHQVPLAIKGFKEEYALSDEDVKNFEREAYEWTQLEIHQNIVRAGFVDLIARRPFIFMEYVAGAEGIGSSLAGWIEHKRLDLEKALKMATEIANGMEYASRKRGLIHRDLKPDNVLVTSDGVAKVTDFGMAKAIEMLKATELEVKSGGRPAVRKSLVVSRGGGTPLYMAPEQFPEVILNYYNYPLFPVDTRSDVYAFGLVLYEMLTGKHVFQADPSLESVIAQEAEVVCRQLFPQLCEERNLDSSKHQELYDNMVPYIYCFRRLLKLDLPDPSTNKSLNRLILKCLEIEPDNRYAGFREVRDELARLYREVSGKEIKLELTPPELEVWDLINKGNSLVSLGSYEEALAYFNKSIEIDSSLESAQVWASKGNSLSHLGRYEEALSCYDRAIKIEPKYALAWTNKGIALYILGRHKKALECFDRAIKTEPRDASAWGSKGGALFDLGKCEEAFECFDKAIEIDPRMAGAWAKKGNSLLELGRHEEALICFDRCVEIDPRFPVVWNRKGVSLGTLGRHEKALECFERALEIEPRDAHIWVNKGMALSALGRHEEALACYDRATEIDPRYAKAWFKKGVSLAELGRLRAAASCFEKVLEINPSDEMAQENKRMCLAHLGSS